MTQAGPGGQIRTSSRHEHHRMIPLRPLRTAGQPPARITSPCCWKCLRKAMLAIGAAGALLAVAACGGTGAAGSTTTASSSPPALSASAWAGGRGEQALLAVEQDLVQIATDGASGIPSPALLGDGGNLASDARVAHDLPLPGDPGDYQEAMTDLETAGYDLGSGDISGATAGIQEAEPALATALRSAAVTLPGGPA